MIDVTRLVRIMRVIIKAIGSIKVIKIIRAIRVVRVIRLITRGEMTVNRVLEFYEMTLTVIRVITGEK